MCCHHHHRHHHHYHWIFSIAHLKPWLKALCSLTPEIYCPVRFSLDKDLIAAVLADYIFLLLNYPNQWDSFPPNFTLLNTPSTPVFLKAITLSLSSPNPLL